VSSRSTNRVEKSFCGDEIGGFEPLGEAAVDRPQQLAYQVLGGRRITAAKGRHERAIPGDHKAGENTLGTFNPLFPNGYYFTLAGYTGYVQARTSVLAA